MTIHLPSTRRDFLSIGAGAGVGLFGALGALGAAPGRAWAQTMAAPGAAPQGAAPLTQVRIVGNQAAENQVLWELMQEQGYLTKLGIDGVIVDAGSPQKTIQALLDGSGDICMIAGFNGVIPAIATGAKVKLVGSALRRPNLLLYSNNPKIQTLKDLVGKKVGVGPVNNLLHQVMIAILRKKGIDPAKVDFVNIGSNADVFKAVSAGTIDAGPSDVAYFNEIGEKHLHVLKDGQTWVDLPDFTYQTAFASDDAIANKRDALVRTLAAYAELFRFLQTPSTKQAYFHARTVVKASEKEGEAVWNYMQSAHPYSTGLVITDRQLDYLQKLDQSMGMIPKVMPNSQVADMSLARDALKLIAHKHA